MLINHVVFLGILIIDTRLDRRRSYRKKEEAAGGGCFCTANRQEEGVSQLLLDEAERIKELAKGSPERDCLSPERTMVAGRTNELAGDRKRAETAACGIVFS